jgi:hypothetical protein
MDSTEITKIIQGDMTGRYRTKALQPGITIGAHKMKDGRYTVCCYFPNEDPYYLSKTGFVPLTTEKQGLLVFTTMNDPGMHYLMKYSRDIIRAVQPPHRTF